MKLCVSRGTGRSAGRDARENPGIARAVLGVQKARVAEKLHCFLFRRHSAERVCVCVCVLASGVCAWLPPGCSAAAPGGGVGFGVFPTARLVC